MRIGIDLGGTKTEAVVMADNGDILYRQRQATPSASGYDAILDGIKSLVNSLERQAGFRCHVGIGTPGAISSRTGLLKNSNTTCMNGKPVKQDLQQALDRVIRIENDANCFALSEAIDGAGRGFNVVFGVIIGTGVGGGIVFDRKLHSGPQHIAGEWGHNILINNGPRCYCGNQGCVETLLSGPGLQHDFERQGGTPGSTTREIVALSDSGDPIARQTMDRYIDHFGQALAVVVNILDPDAIILGGGMSNIDHLYTQGKERLGHYVFNDELKTPLLPNKHGDSAGVRGAAWLWPADEPNY